MRGFSALVVAGLAVASEAACPNSCSGHGDCYNTDVCSCHPSWQGPDCSQRTCAFGNSWASDSAQPHAYEECSGAGLCDRVTGECKCFDGYSGSSCHRRACPNECSGHGMCRLLGELNTLVPYSADNWDSDHIQACVCDAGFSGTDCSQRRCATGDDPLTLCDDDEKGSVQTISVSLSSDGMDLFDSNNAQLHIGAVDHTGQVYYAPTAAEHVFDPVRGAKSIEAALENIPSFKVRDVNVVGNMVGTNVYTYTVSFIPDAFNSANFGIQNTLVCDSGYGCSNAGCQPIVKMPFLVRYAAVGVNPATGVVDSVDLGVATSTRSHVYGGASSGTPIRLASTSMPRLPPNVPVDNGYSAADVHRYDIRVVVAVQDVEDPVNADGATDVYWTKVVYTNTNITTDGFEYEGGDFGVMAASKNYKPTLNGFTSRGFIPTSLVASVPDAPGVILQFPGQNIVATSGQFVFYEILIKLPFCEVATVNTVPISPQVENIECSNRGLCNRDTGMCECFDGYYGVACHRQTVLV